MRHPIILDFETKHTFREYSDPKKLGISVAGVYDYATDELKTYEENKLAIMFTQFEKASILIGYNLDSFDLPVMQKYYPGDVSQFKTFDILTDIKNIIGRRIPLDNVAKATLGEGKSGHGLRAIKLFKEGRMDELKDYCLDDVRLTKQLFDYGVQNRKIYYENGIDKTRIHVDWEKYMDYQGKDDDVSLTLPF